MRNWFFICLIVATNCIVRTILIKRKNHFAAVPITECVKESSKLTNPRK